jgi:hypothetical protein
LNQPPRGADLVPLAGSPEKALPRDFYRFGAD